MCILAQWSKIVQLKTCRYDCSHISDIPSVNVFKRNANAFSLNAIVDVRHRRCHEMIVFEYLRNY